MSRFVDIEAPLPSRLRIGVGDVLRLAVSGGRVDVGERVVEPLGAFVPGTVGTHGDLLSPEGGPTAYVVRAVGKGTARLTLFASRGGFGPAVQHEIEIVVD